MHLCGPRTCSVQKRTELLTLIKFSLFLELFYDLFNVFPITQRPAEHFLFGMWPSDQFELETPGVVRTPIVTFLLIALLWYNHHETLETLLRSGHDAVH
jgi:hypothetical protein